MPKVDVKRDLLFQALGREYTQHEFELLCFEYGVELDDVLSEKEKISREKGNTKEAANASTEVIYKIDVPANRYDLLCLEGISRALLVFLGKMAPPVYHLKNPSTLQRIIAKPETLKIRPVVVGAVLRNIKFTQVNYDSFIDLQDKLHQNICRKRTLVSIGTHDLDTIKGPFTYEALPPKDIKFTALNMDKELNAVELFEHIDSTHSHLQPYLDIIRSAPAYPVIYDSNRTVLSLPPIINGNHSKITLDTKNVLIEITATDRTKADVVLHTMIAMFSQYCDPQWSVESVEVQEADGKVVTHPDLTERTQTASVDYIKKAIGVDIKPDEVATLLNRMSLPAKLNKSEVQVRVPITRSDIMHACDIMEDVAIAYGFNKIQAESSVPKTVTVGNPQPLNKVSDLIRIEVANAGYTEILNFCLCSLDENFKNLRRPNDETAVILDSNSEFQCGRLALIGGVLRSLSANKAHQLPLHLFEVGDVFQKDSSTDTGASNKRKIAALHCATVSSFETIHGLVDRIMLLLRIPAKQGKEDGYYIKPSDDPAFFPGRSADVFVSDKKVGVMGVVHPEVLHNFAIPHPCTAMELEITLDLARWHNKK